MYPEGRREQQQQQPPTNKKPKNVSKSRLRCRVTSAQKLRQLTLGVDEDVALRHDVVVLEGPCVTEIRSLGVKLVEQELSLVRLHLL